MYYTTGIQLRRKIPALRGRFTDHHALLIGMCLEHTSYLEAAIARLDDRVDAVFATISTAGQDGEGGAPLRPGP